MKNLVLRLSTTEKREILKALIIDDLQLTPGQKTTILAELPETKAATDKSKDEPIEITDAQVQADIQRLGDF